MNRIRKERLGSPKLRRVAVWYLLLQSDNCPGVIDTCRGDAAFEDIPGPAGGTLTLTVTR